MKKKLMIFIFLLGVLLSQINLSTASAYGPSERRFGAGIIAGEPTGITFKGYLSHSLALDVIGSWSFVDDAFTLISDVTYDFMNIAPNASSVKAPFYAGAGVKIGFHSKRNNEHKTVVGIRVPLGVAVQWTEYPVELFLEVGPGIEVAPETEFDISGGLGVRYYFF